VWHLARELQALGVTLDLLAFSASPDDANDIAHYAPYFGDVQLIPEPTRTPFSYLWRVGVPSARFPRRARSAWSPALWEAIEAQLAGQKYDAVHLFGGIQVYEYWHALKGARAIITPYESFTLYLARALAQTPSLANRARYAIAQAYERFMFTPYAHTVVVSDVDAQELKRIQPELNVRVLPNGVDTAYFAPADSPRDAQTLLFVGNYEYAPNVDAVHALMRHVMPAVWQSAPQARLLIVGNAPPPDVQAYASERVQVTGRVPDVRPYLAQATAFVSPLRLGAGIKNKVLEALAMAVPTIATPLSVDGIRVQDGVSALVADVDGMAHAVLRLFGDSALQAQLAHEGRALVQGHYSWRATAQGYLALYGGG
jgi:glycosyltransferase involved in cell wall biosynthesis